MGSPFDGTWTMDPKKSLAWDYSLNRYVPEPIIGQVNTYRHEGGRQVATCRIDMGGGYMRLLGYELIVNSGQFVPYVILDEQGERPAHLLSGMTPRKVGDAIAEMALFETDPRTQWRLSRPPNGETEGSMKPYAMVRSLSDDGESYTATCIGPDGITHLVKYFDRTSEVAG